MNALEEIKKHFPEDILHYSTSVDNVLTLWVTKDVLKKLLIFLKNDISLPFKMLYDITAIDERERKRRNNQPQSDFTLVYHLTSFGRNEDIRIKVPLTGDYPISPSITDIWQNANWYEREVFDMFGIKFDGHPSLKRILMPQYWEGHPLRKEHPARATEMDPFVLSEEFITMANENLKFDPKEWGWETKNEDVEYLFLNLGPDHPGTHGLLRLILQLDGEEIVNILPDIGYHHRGAEKMAERQTWHKYIPYTDRIDYTSGVMNNLAYLVTVEKMVGISVPARAQVIRVMLSELYRIASHLVWYGTFAQDLGQISPVFYTFNDRKSF